MMNREINIMLDDTIEEALEEQVKILNDITDLITELVEQSPHNIDPEHYFIWMYATEPFAEA